MKTLFFGFLVSMVIFSVFGTKLRHIAQDSLNDVLNIKEDISSLGINSEIEDMDSNELQEMVAQKYLEKGSLKSMSEELDPEIEAMLSQIRKEQVMVVNPIVQKLLDMEEPGKEQKIISAPKKFFINIMKKFENLNNPIGIGLFIISVIIFLFVFVTFENEFSGLGVSLAKLGFSISRFCILAGAVIAPIVWFSLKYNMLINMSGILLWGPLAIMIFSAISLKVYDFNSPIWNRMFLSTIWPIISGLIIHTV